VADPPPTRELAVVGVSASVACGVRDHGRLLAEQLRSEGDTCSVHWLEREAGSLTGAHAEFRDWSRGLRRELSSARPDAVLLHYSVFSYSHRGLPVFVPEVLSALRAAGTPVLGILHELAYRLHFGGWRGKAWGVSQRLALIDVMRTCAAAIVTAPERVEWLCSRRWLARRPVLLAPVFSNLPSPRPDAAPAPGPPRLGLFGYAYQGAAIALVLDAVAALRARGIAAELVLLGAPGPASEAGQAWRAAAAARGLATGLSFSGRLPAQELADTLARCDVLVFPDVGGPTARKGTLAGSLASGRPLVAIDGPHTWRELVAAEAVSLAVPTPAGLADALAEQLQDGERREALGARGRRFAATEMGLAHTARVVRTALSELAPARSR
jgi:glycosyltransferase involved in cell wall biosynthesis